MINEETSFGDGFSDGNSGRQRRGEFRTKEQAERYQNGYVAGESRLKDRFADYQQNTEQHEVGTED